MAPSPSGGLTIGDLANRTGLAVSAIRFYETHGILHPVRNAGGHRRYGRETPKKRRYLSLQSSMSYCKTVLLACFSPFLVCQTVQRIKGRGSRWSAPARRRR